ncbi:DNA replication factor C complex subunit Rfc1 [Gurleya vavrai]
MEEDLPLAGLTFVFTGELSSDREDAQAKVIMLGGRVTTAPSSKTTYLVTGSEPGPSKIKKANDLKIKLLNEEEFLSLIKKNEINFKDEIQTSVNNNETSKNISYEPWCEKYRPKKITDLVGNNTNIESLRDFLNGKTKFKAALISGTPGIGKTTAVQIIAKEYNLDLIEFNASDTRNKSEITANIKNNLNTYSLSRNQKQIKKVLLMDEIDGMTSDRGGLAELNFLIKNTKIPIVCICNDRNHPKLRTIANNCLDLRFRRLEARQILPRIKKILELEGKQLKDNMINEIISHSHGDLRYCLNTLQNLLLRKTISHEQLSLIIKKL